MGSFRFQGGERSDIYEDLIDFSSSEVEFQTTSEDGHGSNTPPLWKNRAPEGNEHEDLPLLSHNDHLSHLSPNLRLQAIMRGRRELMEMVQNMPESNLELSLKDIVVDEARKDTHIMEKGLSSDTEVQARKQKKRNNKGNKILRSKSMESRQFLLKMISPISFRSRENPRVRNSSSVSPRPSVDGTESLIEKEWWKKRYTNGGESKSSESGSGGSTSSSSNNSNESRHEDGRVMPGCWPMFNTRKSKMK